MPCASRAEAYDAAYQRAEEENPRASRAETRWLPSLALNWVDAPRKQE
jgi:hypothetical protein